MMLRQLRPALGSLLVLTLLTGVAYPLVVTGVARVLFPFQANGSLIERDGRVRGSELIGQNFEAPEYFWGRLSATSPAPYTAFDAERLTGSSGSNFGPLHPQLAAAARARIAALQAADPTNRLHVPVDLLTSSASGLDPHISPAAAAYQAPRVARARRISEATVTRLIGEFSEGRQFGFLGEPRVNVLKLNLALDAYGR